MSLHDLNGNILGLQRYGQLSSGGYGLLDDLSYTLHGNQLRSVDDAASAIASAGGFEFKDAVHQADEYAYDANGNLTKDLNRNICEIQYNILNLPRKVVFAGGDSISYVYAADGTKLRSTATIGGVTTKTDYCGNVIYENVFRKYLLVDGGYVTLSDGKYHYYLRDHQGNNRVVAGADGTVEEVNHYYPFGGVFASSGNAQPYKYNGKELEKSLHWYDYGARRYDAVLGRFTTVDPSAEKTYSWSPYAYCYDNPVLHVDPTGKFGETVWDVFNVILGIDSFKRNFSSGNYKAAAVDGAGVLLDAASSMIPFVPGGAGAAIKGARAADKAVDAVQTVTKAEDAAHALGKGKHTVETANVVSHVSGKLTIEIAPENKIDRSLLNPPTKRGNAPTFKDTKEPVEIHHVGQNPNGPFKEMSSQEHRGKGNFKKNHPFLGEPSKIDRNEFNKAKEEYWIKEYGQ